MFDNELTNEKRSEKALDKYSPDGLAGKLNQHNLQINNGVFKMPHTFTGLGVRGYAKGGIIKGPGTGTSDSIPKKLLMESAIIPAHIVKMLGKDYFDKLVAAAPKSEAKPDKIDAKVSNGEYYLPPHVVKYWGTDFIIKLIGSDNEAAENNDSHSEESAEMQHYAEGGVVKPGQQPPPQEPTLFQKMFGTGTGPAPIDVLNGALTGKPPAEKPKGYRDGGIVEDQPSLRERALNTADSNAEFRQRNPDFGARFAQSNAPQPSLRERLGMPVTQPPAPEPNLRERLGMPPRTEPIQRAPLGQPMQPSAPAVGGIRGIVNGAMQNMGGAPALATGLASTVLSDPAVAAGRDNAIAGLKQKAGIPADDTPYHFADGGIVKDENNLLANSAQLNPNSMRPPAYQREHQNGDKDFITGLNPSSMRSPDAQRGISAPVPENRPAPAFLPKSNAPSGLAETLIGKQGVADVKGTVNQAAENIQGGVNSLIGAGRGVVDKVATAKDNVASDYNNNGGYGVAGGLSNAASGFFNRAGSFAGGAAYDLLNGDKAPAANNAAGSITQKPNVATHEASSPLPVAQPQANNQPAAQAKPAPTPNAQPAPNPALTPKNQYDSALIPEGNRLQLTPEYNDYLNSKDTRAVAQRDASNATPEQITGVQQKTPSLGGLGAYQQSNANGGAFPVASKAEQDAYWNSQAEGQRLETLASKGRVLDPYTKQYLGQMNNDNYPAENSLARAGLAQKANEDRLNREAASSTAAEQRALEYAKLDQDQYGAINQKQYVNGMPSGETARIYSKKTGKLTNDNGDQQGQDDIEGAYQSLSPDALKAHLKSAQDIISSGDVENPNFKKALELLTAHSRITGRT